MALHSERSVPTEDTFSGAYCLFTDRTDWEETKRWQTYIILADIETVLRSLGDARFAAQHPGVWV